MAQDCAEVLQGGMVAWERFDIFVLALPQIEHIMKGKREFTRREISEIRFLIRQKELASSTEQERIRYKIRRIGFYWSDFNFGKSEEYNMDNFDKLISNGIIRIIGEPANPKPSPAQKQKAEGTDARPVKMNMSNKEEGSIIKPIKMNISKKEERNMTRPVKMNISQKENETVAHPVKQNLFKEGLKPWVGNDPKVLILGTMPGDKSLSMQAYYCDTAHNSFWKLMRTLFPVGRSDNKEFITSHGIALWDCIHSGVRKGSSDKGFDMSKNVPNNLKAFLTQHPKIQTIILNGISTKKKFFDKYFPKFDACRVITISSSSNANSKFFEEKLEEWSIITTLAR